VTAGEITAEDRQHIDWAVGRAAKHGQLADPTVYDFLRAVLTVEHRPVARTHDVLEFVRKFQQLTGPVMAKGLEDTSFYRYHRLISLNEVGGDPRRFGLSVAAFHHLTERRATHAGGGLVATSTHDTKRGEDMRARLNLLSEMPAAWGSRVTRWSRLNRLKRRQVDDQPAPTRNDEYLLYQTLIGAWPLALGTGPGDGIASGPLLDAFIERLVAYMTKALREAKERSSWTQPNAPYEDAVADFIRRILDARRPNLFLADFLAFQRRIAELGLVNGLAQTVLKLTIPGVPDIYQGTEFWDLSLVDPDNRRPVDYAARRAGLAANAPIEALAANWSDGRIKQRVIQTLLQHRRRHRDLYETGAYRPLSPTGARAEHLLAFERRGDAAALVVLVPVLVSRLVNGAGLPVGTSAWGDATVTAVTGGRWRELFTGIMIEAAEGDHGFALPVAEALAHLPVACLERVAA
jgi:(1->4)-alpha-D-glucan 1-alpha-D-glucosylmutase